MWCSYHQSAEQGRGFRGLPALSIPMNKRRKAPPPKRRWQRFTPAYKIMPSPERIAAMKEHARAMGFDDADERIEQIVNEDNETWKNDRYTVVVNRHPKGWVTHLSIKRNDRGPEIPWRHLQRIKSELAGDETEAFELFPAESRLVDTANQRWLWCVPPGMKLPVGFDEGRHVGTPEQAAAIGARQKPLEDDDAEDT